MIIEFLDGLYADTPGKVSAWWRETPGAKSPIDRSVWFNWPAERQKMVEFINSKAEHDVYVPVSQFDAERRKPEHATVARVLWNDSDRFDTTKYRVAPSLIVRTSEGRTHCYWNLDKAYPAEQAELVVRKLTYAHVDAGADVSSWSRAKLLRVPGTMNTSHGFPEEVKVESNTGKVYTLAEIANAYDDVSITPNSPKVITTGDEPRADFTAVAPEDLPDFFTAQAKLPEDFPLELMTAEPTIGEDGNRSELRWRLIAELVEAGLSDEEVFVIAQQSPAASKWTDPGERRGLDGLFAEILKERVRYESGVIPDATPVEPVKMRGKHVEILTAEERKRAKRAFEKCWIYDYERWIAENLETYNPPYHRAAAWMSLSVIVGAGRRIVIRGKDAPFGLFFFVLGKTSTGKSEAKSYMQDAVHDSAPGCDIGDDQSGEALMDVLRDREEGATLMSSDEVDGLLGSMVDNGGWRGGDISRYTYLYDGIVQGIARKGNIENAGKWTKTQFNWFGMGTPDKVFNILNRDMFESGFLARFQWFFGEDLHVEENDLGVKVGGTSNYKTRMDQVSKWTTAFNAARQSLDMLKMGGQVHQLVEPDSDDTAAFLARTTARVEYTLWRDDPNYDILQPSIRRTMVAATKMAALLALARGELRFTKDDVLVALWQTEDLLSNLHYAASRVAASAHARALDALWNFVAGHGEDVSSQLIYRRMSATLNLSVSQVDGYRDELRAQRRLSYVQTGERNAWKATAVKMEGE